MMFDDNFFSTKQLKYSPKNSLTNFDFCCGKKLTGNRLQSYRKQWRLQSGPFKIMRIQEPHESKLSQMKKLKTWSFPEMVRYTLYLHTVLENNIQKAKERWTKKDFEQMSKIVRSRNSNQCRIFHSKMTQIHHDLMDIFNFFKCNIKEYNSIHDKFINERNKIQSSVSACSPVNVIEDISQRFDREEQKSQPYDAFEHIMENIEHDFPIVRPEEEERVSRQRYDWFEEFDDYLSNLQGSWLDDI